VVSNAFIRFLNQFAKTEATTLPDGSKQQYFSTSAVDSYAEQTFHVEGWPTASADMRLWPVHCYGMIGVGRNYSPDTGSGAELYTVIGHAPRHLDRNIALVGRIVEGMEHLSSLPRGSGALGFYTEEEFDKRAPILSVRVASDLSDAEKPVFEYLSTDSKTFAKYADARANRRDPFFIVPAGGTDICNIPVPVRRVSKDAE
jgi:peptidylprolyl isomerase